MTTSSLIQKLANVQHFPPEHQGRRRVESEARERFRTVVVEVRTLSGQLERMETWFSNAFRIPDEHLYNDDPRYRKNARVWHRTLKQYERAVNERAALACALGITKEDK